jgi:hypothetical protein
MTLLNYKSADSRSSISGNVNGGIEYAHFFGSFWGLSVGAEIASFSTFYKFNDRSDSLSLYDEWSTLNYKFHQNLSTLEYQNISYYSFPVKINYRCKFNEQLNFNVSIGAAYTKYFSEKKSIVSGFIDRQSDFEAIHVVVDDYKPIGFGKFNNYIHPSAAKQFKSTILGIAQVGFSFRVAPNLNAHTELNFQYGFVDIKTRSVDILNPNEYSGITATNYIGEIHPISLGLRIGVTYIFDIFNVDCKCHPNWE